MYRELESAMHGRNILNVHVLFDPSAILYFLWLLHSFWRRPCAIDERFCMFKICFSVSTTDSGRYQDHGFFIGWEQDGGLADAQAKTYKFVKEVGGKYYQKYVPWQLRQGVLTIYTKGLYYYKKAYKQVSSMWYACTHTLVGTMATEGAHVETCIASVLLYCTVTSKSVASCANKWLFYDN